MAALKLDLDYNLIRKAMIHAIMYATGLDQNHAIVLEQEAPDAPRPTLPYMGMKITTPGRRFGDDTKQNVLDGQGNSTESWSSGGPRGMKVSFNCYAQSHEDAYNLMSLWQTGLDEENTQSLLRQAGVAVWLIGTVEDLSALLNTAYEGRAQMDCEFGIAMNVISDLGSETSVTVDGQVTTDQGNVVNTTQTITGD